MSKVTFRDGHGHSLQTRCTGTPTQDGCCTCIFIDVLSIRWIRRFRHACFIIVTCTHFSELWALGIATGCVGARCSGSTAHCGMRTPGASVCQGCMCTPVASEWQGRACVSRMANSTRNSSDGISTVNRCDLFISHGSQARPRAVCDINPFAEDVRFGDGAGRLVTPAHGAAQRSVACARTVQGVIATDPVARAGSVFLAAQRSDALRTCARLVKGRGIFASAWQWPDCVPAADTDMGSVCRIPAAQRSSARDGILGISNRCNPHSGLMWPVANTYSNQCV